MRSQFTDTFLAYKAFPSLLRKTRSKGLAALVLALLFKLDLDVCNIATCLAHVVKVRFGKSTAQKIYMVSFNTLNLGTGVRSLCASYIIAPTEQDAQCLLPKGSMDELRSIISIECVG